jgi:predicted naringenin-chalcone synthase
MDWFKREATPLALEAIQDCLGTVSPQSITHLVTVSCTGLSAPGIDLEIVRALGLPLTVSRTSVNFMGCYAAIHALKLADAFCKADHKANVLIVAVELCTLHFQKELTVDNITSSMLFGDGAAAVLVNNESGPGVLEITHFHTRVAPDGQQDMAWELSSSGFRMTLSSYVPGLVEQSLGSLVQESLAHANLTQEEIAHWCIHPGGKKILESAQKSIGLANGRLDTSYDVLKKYGNMSSPTILFVLREIAGRLSPGVGERIFVAAFGPGLTMETLILNS